jgi:protein TonB
VPRLASSQPFYPREPFDARIEGTVGLVLVVKADGSIGDIRVGKSVEPNLDEAAIASARKWRFSPGTKDGEPVDVIVSMTVAFGLRK